MKYPKQQVYTIVAAVLFLVGAIFMLINTFADMMWAFWAGLIFACAATIIYILLVLENRKIVSKNMKDTSQLQETKNPST